MRKEIKHILPKAAMAALVAAVVVYCVMINIEKNAMKAYEKESIFVAARDIAKGSVLTQENASEYIAEKQMDKNLIPDAAVTQKELLYEKMAQGNVDKGAILTKSMFDDLEKMIDDMREPVTAGFKAEDLYQVVSGILRCGDRIHIYTVDAQTKNAYLVWDDIFIREVFDSAGNIIPPDDNVTAAQRINVLIEKENVEQFYSELAAGSLRVVKAME